MDSNSATGEEMAAGKRKAETEGGSSQKMQMSNFRMSRTPADLHISVKLASVLEDIGVNENTVQISRRRLVLLMENIITITNKLSSDSTPSDSVYFFGSQSEGTTTVGLNSDHDILNCDGTFIVLQGIGDWEWKPDVINLLLFQDKSTPPGYCMLQNISSICEQITPPFTTQYADKIMLKNSLRKLLKLEEMDEHGPAICYTSEQFDHVHALAFRTLPKCVTNWLEQQLQKGRLTLDMKKYIECHPCYVVPVGCKGRPNEELQWRISTSHAERCVMFNLNITQIQCYVLLKMMLKEHLKHPSEKGLSSFMCKNILLLYIEDTKSDDWRPESLLFHFKCCLLKLEQCVSKEYCPHFIIHDNNLMADRFTPKVKTWLLDKIQELYKNSVSHFCCLKTDAVGSRLETKRGISNINFPFENREVFSRNLVHLASRLISDHNMLLNAVASGKTTFSIIILNAIQLYKQGDSLQQTAILLLTPLIYSSLGSEKASSDIEQGQPVSPKALVWLSLGLDSDVTSGRLKLASVYYCAKDYSKAEAILKITEEKYDTRKIQAMCICRYEDSNWDFSYEVLYNLYGKDEQVIRHVFAYGIRFLRSEIYCVPKELRYEMFRSTKEDLERSSVTRSIESLLKELLPEKLSVEKNLYIHSLNKKDFDWMDRAVVDSLPYLYFLQYKTYGHLKRHADQKQALTKFASSINITKGMEHMETSLNLLGQCYEQENRHKEAFRCYTRSLQIRSRNNAASIHICRLLNSLLSARR